MPGRMPVTPGMCWDSLPGANLLAMPLHACIFLRTRKAARDDHQGTPVLPLVDGVLTPDLLGPDRSFERTTVGADGMTKTKTKTKTQTWPAEVIAAVEAAVVCGCRQDGCNGGWMSGLDG
jgi:hypothetical protein